MRISSLYGSRPVFSFEFFPPKSDAGYRTLFRTIEELKQLSPAFVSMTSHARGANRPLMIELVGRIQKELGITAVAHLPCSGQSRATLHEALEALAAQGIVNLMALGGDPASDDPEWQPAPDGFFFANELVSYVREHFDFTMGSGCYPEKHHRAPSFEIDIENLKRKVDAGVEVLFTQLFLDNAHYFRFVDRVRAAGIEVPIIPGLMPMVSAQNLKRAMGFSPGSETPAELERSLADAVGDKERSLDIGVEWATLQSQELLERGAPGIHFYTLNQSPATRRVRQNLGE
jgi:methylenetetrahydrofolate reductase (NADPH)